jgi:hypothetical protein
MALIPSVDEFIAMLFYHGAEYRQLVAPKAPRLRQLNRLQPKLRVLLRALHMDMSGLVAFSTEEEEPETPRPQHFWHTGTIVMSLRFHKPKKLRPQRPGWSDGDQPRLAAVV